jgi:hypothetical protein
MYHFGPGYPWHQGQKIFPPDSPCRQRSKTVEEMEQWGPFRTVPTTEGTETVGTVGSTVPLEQTVEQVLEEEIDFDAR